MISGFIWFVKKEKQLLLFEYIIFILQSFYVAEEVDEGIPNNRLYTLQKTDDYYLDIRSIFIFERLFFLVTEVILFKHCVNIEFNPDFE